MMKKFLVLLVMLFLASNVYAIPGSNYMTANTVSFNTTGVVVTFNTTVNKIIVINESSTDTIHVTFTGLGWTNDGLVYNLPTSQGASSSTVNPQQAAVRLVAGQSLTWNVNTTKIGFIKTTSSLDSGNVQYIASSEQAQP